MNKFVLIASFLLLLTACTRTEIIPCSKKEGCQMTCKEKLILCKKICVDNCQNCQKISKVKAIKGYNQFVREKHLQGGMVTRRPRAYRDPLECIKTTCNCMADYNVCLQAKTGLIKKSLQTNRLCTYL